MKTLFEIKLDRVAKGSRVSAQSLLRQLRAAILDGRLGTGAKLPPTRQSEECFGVSRNTAAEVYERLLEEGYVVSRRGSGTFVADKLPEPAPQSKATPDGPPDSRLNSFWLRQDVTAAMGFWRDPPARRSAPAEAPPIDFRPALVDSRLFPHDVYRRVSARRMRGLERNPASFNSPQGNQGNYSLREAIIKHIAFTRAVACHPDDVVVTSGAQQAFDLLARTLVTAGETVVAIEDPGYPPMRIAFAAAGAKLVPVGVDREGLIVQQLPLDVGIICVTPSHQFPLGVAMSMGRRVALVEFARQRGAVIIEDDYDGEFRYEGSPLEALRAADAADIVFYVGTFSKCMLSSIRLGFVVAPDWAIRTLITAKNALDWHCATPVQTAVAAFIAEGHLSHHVRKMRELYQRRRQLLLEVIERDLGEWLEPIPSFYGMHVAALARGALILDGTVEELLQHNVKIHSLRRYYLGTPVSEGLVIGYGAVDLRQMEQGLEALRKALQR